MSIKQAITESELKADWNCAWIGTNMVVESVLDSTNTTAMRMGEQGVAHGTLIVADRQTSGRGRRGRNWMSEEGVSIAMTILMRPQIEPGNAPMLTLVAALAVVSAIQSHSDKSVSIKWPNDIVIDGKKVCGILTEMSTQVDSINHIALGIGINVRHQSFPSELSEIATTLEDQLGKSISRALLIRQVCENFEKYYQVFTETQDLSKLVKEYDEYLVNRGKKVKIIDPKEPFEGIACGITPRGELLVDTEEGQKCVSSGEVSVRGIYGYV